MAERTGRTPDGAEGFRAGAPERSEALRPTSRFGKVFSAVGNYELKAWIIAGTERNRDYTPLELSRKLGMTKSQGVSVRQFMVHTFIPAGIAASREVVGPSGAVVTAYAKTDSDNLGTQIAEQMLALSERHPDFSLLMLWGQTGAVDSDARSAPMTRLAILKAMVDRSTPLSVSKLLKELGGPRIKISNHLQALADAGVLTYERIKVDEADAQFVLRGEPTGAQFSATEGFKDKTLLNVVEGLLADVDAQGVITAPAVHEAVLAQAPQYQELDQENLRHRLSKILLELESRGVTERAKFPKGSYSRVSLKDGQRAKSKDIVDTVRAIETQDQQALAAGKAQADDILADPQRIGALIDKAETRSGLVGRAGAALLKRDIKDIIARIPGIRSGAIRTALIELGHNVSWVRVANLLTEMQEGRELGSEKVGRGNRYYPLVDWRQRTEAGERAADTPRPERKPGPGTMYVNDPRSPSRFEEVPSGTIFQSETEGAHAHPGGEQTVFTAGDLGGGIDPLEKEVPLAQRHAARRAADRTDRTKRQGK